MGELVTADRIELFSSVLSIALAIAGAIAYVASSRFRNAVRRRAPWLVRILRELGDHFSAPPVLYASIAYVFVFAVGVILPSGRLSAIVRPSGPAIAALDLLFFAALLISIFGSVRHARDRTRLERQKVQVIAWEGWEEETLYESSPRRGFARDFLEFLLYVRGLGTVPVLFTSKGRGYDVIVSDAEFIPSYSRRNRLRRLDDQADLRESWDSLSATVLKLFERLIAPSGHRTAIPCRFGFQEILATKELVARMARDGLDTDSAKSFAPHELMAKYDDIQIGIWDWYLPAISVLLHVHPKIHEPIAKTRTIHRGRVEECLQDLQTEEFRERIKLIEYLPDIANRLRRGQSDIVYGAGSWALDATNDGIEIVRPKEGVFVWAECAGILSDSDSADRNSMLSLIRHWVSEATQMKLGQGEALRALPTNLKALRAVVSSEAKTKNSKHPARETLEWLCDLDRDILRPDRVVTPRQLPVSNAGNEDLGAVEWELVWSDFQKWRRRS